MAGIIQDLDSPASDGVFQNVPGKWLQRCVGDAAGFLADSFNKAPYLSRGDSGRFEGILSQVELNRLLAMGTIPATKVRVVDRGRPVSARTWVTEANNVSVVNGKKIGLLVDKGCTLTISEMEKFTPRLFELCGGLQTELSYRFRANIYFTPPFAQGFNTHFDDHDVIVLQLEGDKDWQVFPRITEEPDGPENVTLPADQRAVIKASLRAGDSLYIPRGFAHCAASAEQPSLHVSIGVYPVTVADLLSYAVDELAASPELARPLQPGFAHRPEGLQELVADGLRALNAQLGDNAEANELARAFCRIWVEARARGLSRRPVS